MRSRLRLASALLLQLLVVLAGCERGEEASSSTGSAEQAALVLPKGTGFDPSALAAEPVTLVVAPPAVGEVRVERVITDMRLEVTTAEDGTLDLRHYTIEVRTAEVLAVNDEAPTKVRVTYRTHGAEQQVDDQPARTETAPVEGHTYVADVTGGALVITREDGGEPTEDELRIVRDDHERLGRAAAFSRSLPDGPLAPGEAVELSPEARAELFASDPDQSVRDVSVVYRGLSRYAGASHAAFEVTATLVVALDDQGSRLTTKLAGYVLVDPATARRTHGLMTGEVEYRERDVSGTGRVDFIAKTERDTPD